MKNNNKKIIKIEEKNPVISVYKGNPDDLVPILSYETESWVTAGRGKKRVKNTEVLIGNKGIFLTGFIPKVEEYLDFLHMPYKISRKKQTKIEVKEPSLPGIIFRKDQYEAIKKSIKKKRGYWKGPTGSGKTIICCGIMSSLQTKSIIVVHTKELFNQTYEKLCSYFGKDKVGRIGDKVKEFNQYNVGMVKTLANLKTDIRYEWGLIIIDEVHHCNNIKGIYAKVLNKVYAPYRFGVTATPPKDDDKRLALEGLIGPKIGETTYEELIEIGVLAKPRLSFIRIPPNKKMVYAKGKYTTLYRKGIVQNRVRNSLIIQEAKHQMEMGRSVLIMVERLLHGVELSKFAELEFSRNNFVFLHGETDKEALEQVKTEKRKWIQLKKKKEGYLLEIGIPKKDIKQKIDKDEKVKKAKKKFEKKKVEVEKTKVKEMRHKFERKEVHCVIATRVWSEGIDIKSIGAVINAVGGKSEIAAIQRFGRGMRVDKDKDEVILIDCLDLRTYRDFEIHTGDRLGCYSDWGWL